MHEYEEEEQRGGLTRISNREEEKGVQPVSQGCFGE